MPGASGWGYGQVDLRCRGNGGPIDARREVLDEELPIPPPRSRVHAVASPSAPISPGIPARRIGPGAAMVRDAGTRDVRGRGRAVHHHGC